ncbi:MULTISPECIES: enoyl-CoA hydratase/isomerase family protein [Variovorax]|jgi:enoyl-CoA hydratase/carnithine racemase|uniref:enoyl-CoA hydratase/isomerase family protein n=1 Tax=Variovorax TaxID=34072 RepID=UPI0007843487|nr:MULTISPECIES: enoyl-CoA hydratase/isomerase family protein [Variovorax]OEZ27429.1 enoyl-CoA hydratase [Variovorax boronicumulans]RSZ44321.1 enoyl-CoA hydratase/isomerase family protein [Variovorax sp. 553]RSZ45022.1 enoyl-CoA hydratase/isomerase family protein [Variovorax sp. 679]
MTYQTIIHEQRESVAWITLNRPAELNSVNLRMLQELSAALTEVAADASQKVLVLTGAGRAFCAGADLKALRGAIDAAPGEPNFSDLTLSTLSQLRNMPKPVIGAMNGLTVAGGLELAMCCDFLVGAASAKIGDGHANYGVFPGGGGAAVLPRRIGLPRAKQLLFTGDLMSAAQMQAWGLLNEVVADSELQPAVAALAARMAGKSPLVLRRMKTIAERALDQPLDLALRDELLECLQHTRSHDFSEGLAAYGEKRAPAFRGV